jgi:excisionase family DNA binding protein
MLRKFSIGVPVPFRSPEHTNDGCIPCIHYTQEIAVGRNLLPDERTSMNATATIECQTLDVKNSATELGVCEETVRRLVRRKVLRKLPGLRRVLIPRTELDRYLNNGNHARLS